MTIPRLGGDSVGRVDGVGLHGVDQLRASVLESDIVAHVLIEVHEDDHLLRLAEVEASLVGHSHGIKLVA